MCSLSYSQLQSLAAFSQHGSATLVSLHFGHTGSLLLALGVHSLRNLFLLFLVPQMSLHGLSWSRAGTHSPTARTLMPGRLDALGWNSS